VSRYGDERALETGGKEVERMRGYNEYFSYSLTTLVALVILK
jgi:hypothetical protein